MRSFALFSYSVSLGLHLVCWWLSVFQLRPGRRARAFSLLLVFALAAWPLATFKVSSMLPDFLAGAFSVSAFTWFGAVFYFFLFQVGLGGLGLGFKALPARVSAFFPRGRRQFFWAAALTVLTVAYGLYEASDIRPVHYRFTAPGLKQNLRLLMLADTHIGQGSSLGKTRKLVDLVNSLDPDMVFFVGDIVDAGPDRIERHADALSGIHAPCLGVFGNHEGYVGKQKSRDFFKRAGIRPLVDERLDFPDRGLVLVGIDDPGRSGDTVRDLGVRLERIPLSGMDQAYSVLLVHRPEGWRESALPHGFDLQLSGHTHGGQMFPFSLLVQRRHKFLHGLFQEGGGRLIVTRGAGTWGPPMRVLSPPEVVVIELDAG